VHDAVIVLTTVPSPELGDAVGRALVEERLAACVSVQPAMTSFYRWQGAVTRDTEHQLVIKTVLARVEAVRARLRDLHPYDLPEFLVVAVATGDPGYLAWVTESCGV